MRPRSSVKLLAGGATVITTSITASQRCDWHSPRSCTCFTHAAIGATVDHVPANMASFRDVDALISWVGSEQTGTHGATTEVVKRAFFRSFRSLRHRVPGPLVPGSSRSATCSRRLLLCGASTRESTLSGLGATRLPTTARTSCFPVRRTAPGVFGGDGAYGEKAKAAFDAIAAKWERTRSVGRRARALLTR